MITHTGHLATSDAVDTSAVSGVAWPAIIGGAVAALGLTLILTPLGTAIGVGWSSPWNHMGGFGKTFTIGTALWLIIVQWVASGFGGYLTGRLRSKWPGAHTHEVYFRDTVHGFLAWALAAIVGGLLIASVAAHVDSEMGQNDTTSYFSDSLFRNATTSAGVTEADRTEAHRILAIGVAEGQLPENDRNYLVELISTRTGMSPADANTRVDTVLGREKLSMLNAGKASVLGCLALLIGAFISSVAGALGGLHRDVHYLHGKFHHD